jgi:hypothetical protein
MEYIDSELSQRFARSYTTAAFGYARAASAAYAAMASQTLDFWAQAAQRGSEAPERPATSPYLLSGPQPFRSAMAVTAGEMASPMTAMMRSTQAWAMSPVFAPMRAWWGMFPLEGNPASWPMAYSMMTAGVPRAVAVPAAEANVAAMEAADAAKASMDRVFSSYRSDSGFAVSQVITSRNLAMLLAPLSMMMSIKLPWGT